MRFEDRFLDDIRARLPVSRVVGRKVALKKQGRELAGLSPFKTEKTPSFFVNDHKGFYHCFASGEHGDIFKFVMKMEGLTFPEAVERLAAEAGVALPKATERNVQQEDATARLHAALEASTLYFQETLASAGGAEARRYLDQRGLRPETIAHFRMGYAPNSKSALRERLTRQGFSREDLIATGMLIAGDDIPDPYDRFRHRVMFPITDMKHRVIAFGGRALDPEAKAKYLNSPETPLFHKGSLLFNAAHARPAAHMQGRLVVVEGYMDVIALTEAGFPACVAPLGTALTETQAGLLWRMSPEPIFCFDGDSAGRKAAFRAVDTLLPELGPNQSARFAFIESGFDPDDLVRIQGPEAFEAVLAEAKPFIDVLFAREELAGPLATPEQFAGLQARLKTLVARIRNETVRFHYGQDIADAIRRKTWNTRRALANKNGPRPRDAAAVGRRDNAQVDWRVKVRAQQGWKPQAAKAHATTDLRSSSVLPPREALLMRMLLTHPWLIADHAEDIASLSMASEPLSNLRNAILAAHTHNNSLDTATLHSHLTHSGVVAVVNLVERSSTHRSDGCSEPESGHAEVEKGWRHTLALHQRQTGLQGMLDTAQRDWDADESEEAWERILELRQQIEALHEPDVL